MFKSNKQRMFLEGLRNNPNFSQMPQRPMVPNNVAPMAIPKPAMPVQNPMAMPKAPLMPPSTTPPLGGMASPMNRFKGIKAKLK